MDCDLEGILWMSVGLLFIGVIFFLLIILILDIKWLEEVFKLVVVVVGKE